MIDAVRPDVVVIGGGPSGATVATLIAKAGFRVQLLEREHFPRYHIGESLIPETFWVLERLGRGAGLSKSTACSSSRSKESSPSRFTSAITSRTKARRPGR